PCVFSHACFILPCLALCGLPENKAQPAQLASHCRSRRGREGTESTLGRKQREAPVRSSGLQQWPAQGRVHGPHGAARVHDSLAEALREVLLGHPRPRWHGVRGAVAEGPHVATSPARYAVQASLLPALCSLRDRPHQVLKSWRLRPRQALAHRSFHLLLMLGKSRVHQHVLTKTSNHSHCLSRGSLPCSLARALRQVHAALVWVLQHLAHARADAVHSWLAGRGVAVRSHSHIRLACRGQQRAGALGGTHGHHACVLGHHSGCSHALQGYLVPHRIRASAFPAHIPLSLRVLNPICCLLVLGKALRKGQEGGKSHARPEGKEGGKEGRKRKEKEGKRSGVPALPAGGAADSRPGPGGAERCRCFPGPRERSRDSLPACGAFPGLSEPPCPRPAVPRPGQTGLTASARWGPGSHRAALDAVFANSGPGPYLG
uniref:Uncharacterized protein n=1 Tax=Zonotrichia albicollis TaxID=44394 RepID=A0A8D2M512_ZONAL